WQWSEPAQRANAAGTLEQVQQDFNRSQSLGKRGSLADLIVLGGCAAGEVAARLGGHAGTGPFSRRRTPAAREQTDRECGAALAPPVDGVRNCVRAGEPRPLHHGLIDRAFMLRLTAPEMTALVGGMRALDANFGQSGHGVLTDRPGTLSNDFFVTLLDMGTTWEPTGSADAVYEGRDRGTGEKRWTATAVDLVFGSNSELRAVAEVYACDDAGEKFVHDFVAA